MKKLILILALSVYLLSSIYALDCQYKENYPYFKEVIYFYEDETKLDYNLLEVKDVRQGSPGSVFWGTPQTNTEFTIQNNYGSEINVTINYLFNEVAQIASTLIPAKGYFVVACPGISGLDESSITFDIKTEGLEARIESVQFNNYSCVQCPEGSNFACLNDGENCNNSTQCGGSHCIRGYCSNSTSCFNNDCKCALEEIQCEDNIQCAKRNSVQLGFKPVCKVEECVTGYLNKNGACALKNGESCSINDDCASGECNPAKKCGNFTGCPDDEKLCNNQTCLMPSTKEVREAYQCEFECISQRGKDGICQRSLRENLIFIILILIGLGIGLYFLFRTFYKKGWKKKEDKIIKEAEEKAKKIIEKSQGDLEKINSELDKKNYQKEELEKELSSLKNKKEGSEKVKKEILDLNKEIESLSEEQKNKREELKKEREKLTKERLTPFINKQGYKVYINEEGYEVLERTGTLFHRWWFEHNKNKKIKLGYEIHHKDFTKRNNDIKNLEELSPEEHPEKHFKRYKEK